MKQLALLALLVGCSPKVPEICLSACELVSTWDEPVLYEAVHAPGCKARRGSMWSVESFAHDHHGPIPVHGEDCGEGCLLEAGR